MANVPITWRPLTLWPHGRARTPDHARESAKFKRRGRYRTIAGAASSWEPGKAIPLSRTLDDLDRELWHIGAKDAVVQVDLVGGERAIRQDGQVRADARAATPAVVLSFKRNGVPLVFATDHFAKWEDNLRAIAKGLEALRLLERYHINQSGEQYRGWQALPASTTTALTTEQAAAAIVRRAGAPYTADIILRDALSLRNALRIALARAHPDAGGSNGDFQLVQEAKRVLAAHHGVSL